LAERFSAYADYQGRVRKLIPWIYWSNSKAMIASSNGAGQAKNLIKFAPPYSPVAIKKSRSARD
jgi:hypothetical protein